MNVIEREMQELKEIIENGRINLLPAERVAENILAAGYRKVSKEEYSDYLMLKNNYENAKQEIERLQMDCKRLYRNIGAFRDLIRKETAKEFAEKLKNKLFDFFQENEDLDGKISIGILYIDIIGVEAKDGAVISLGLIDELLQAYEK